MYILRQKKKIKNDYKRKKVLRARFTCDIYAELIAMTKYVNVISSSRFDVSRILSTECALAQSGPRQMSETYRERIVRRFHRQAAWANLHCGGTFRVGVGCIRVAIRATSCRSPKRRYTRYPSLAAYEKLITRVECFVRIIYSLVIYALQMCALSFSLYITFCINTL